MTTPRADETRTTGENGMTSPSSRAVDFYFKCAVAVIGVVGTAANALVLYAMVASKQHRKHLLICNQNVFDLCSCLLLVVTYPLHLCNIRLTGTLGYWLCVVIFSDCLLWGTMNGSITNLASVTVERYLRVVHPIWSKKRLRRWVIGAAAAYAWISGIVYQLALVLSTTAVVDGVCYGRAFSSSRAAEVIHGVWNFVSFFVVVVLIFVVCYWRILAVIRRQASVMAGHRGPGPSSARIQSSQAQSNVIKTMIVVSAFYVVCWMPAFTYYLIFNLTTNIPFNESGYYAVVFICFFYICANPFIYAVKFDPVKCVLLSLIPCKMTAVPVASVNNMIEIHSSRPTTRVVWEHISQV